MKNNRRAWIACLSSISSSTVPVNSPCSSSALASTQRIEADFEHPQLNVILN